MDLKGETADREAIRAAVMSQPPYTVDELCTGKPNRECPDTVPIRKSFEDPLKAALALLDVLAGDPASQERVKDFRKEHGL